ncbi:MAG: AEC family transporter [Chloroflexi bacterium]|nr:AEC family transporter [Chloroflexota bacterium]
MELLNIFANVLLPVFLLIGAGVLLDRKLAIDVKSVSRVAYYIFSPSLIFSSLVTSAVSGSDSAQIFVFVLVITFLVVLVSLAAARLLKLDQVSTSAFLLTTAFMNSGNYGMSVNLFAFGEEGLARAVLYFVASAVLSNTLGVFFAARGRSGIRQALLGILKAPMVYAALAAVAVNLTGLTVPAPLLKAFTSAGNGAVPSLLLILGMQLSRTRLNRDIPAVATASLIRLVVSALLAWGLALLMGVQGVTRQVCILESAMPAAITPLIIAVEFDTNPKLVTSVIFLSTVASMVTLTVLLSLLM